MDFSPPRPESTFSVSFLRLHNAILKQMGEVRSQGVCDKSEQRAVLRKDVAGSREFLWSHEPKRAYIMLMSAIDSAGWGTTEDIFSPRCPPPSFLPASVCSKEP